MMQVRAIKKFHDDKGKLVGYTIQDEATGQQMNVYKENLKRAVINKQCEIVNMTLTSDGRLIGKAAPAPKKRVRQRRNSEMSLMEVYTNGRRMVAGLVDEQQFDEQNNLCQHHQNFHVEHNLMNNIKNGYYNNVKIVDGKPDMSNVKRKSFSKVKDKLLKLLKDNGARFELKVEKSNTKYEYTVVIDGDNKINGSEQTIYCLINDACITNRIKVLGFSENTVTVNCLTGINDVRRALKTIKI